MPKTAAHRRATREFQQFAAHRDCEAFLDQGNVLKWSVFMNGPVGSAWEGAIIPITVQFEGDYPFKQPKVTRSARRRADW